MTRWAQLGAAVADHIVLDHEMSRTPLLLPLLSSRQIKNSWRNCSGKLGYVTRRSETLWGLRISNPDKIILLPITQRRLNMVYQGCIIRHRHFWFPIFLIGATVRKCPFRHIVPLLPFWSGFWHFFPPPETFDTKRWWSWWVVKVLCWLLPGHDS